MRDDVCDVRVAGDGSGVEEIDDGSGCVEEELEDGAGVLRKGDGLTVTLRAALATRIEDATGGGMDEDDSFSGVEFCPDGFEIRVAEVASMVVGLYCYAVGIKLVKGIGDLLEAALNIRQWNARPEAELVRLALL